MDQILLWNTNYDQWCIYCHPHYWHCDDGKLIFCKNADITYHAKEPVGEFKAHVANMWSLVAYPETGDIWLAINDFPAQYGGYEHFNMKDLLGRLR